MKFKRKTFIKLSIILSLFLILFYIKVDSLALNRFIYWANGIFERFVYSPDNRNAIFKVSNKNHYCPKPLIDYQDENSIYYLDKDRELLKPIFKACGNNNDFVEALRIVKFRNKSSESTRLVITKEFLSTELTHPKYGLKCYSQRFDKKYNVSEENHQLDHFEVKEFTGTDSSFEQTIDQPGFYYIFCKKNSFGSQSKIYENVVCVLDENLKSFFLKRQIYRDQIELIKRKLNNSQHHLLAEIPDEETLKNCITKETEAKEKFNILILGFDSVSFNHFKRIFPLTFSFLNNDLEDNIIFEHLNSVGGNTYPNILAMLCGIMEEDFKELNHSSEINFYRDKDSTFHDSFPFIWNLYEDMGYVTMYQEDDPSIAIFNYYKKGFRLQPTSFYGRPFWTKYYDIRSGPEKCHYKKPTFQLWIEQIENFIKQMSNPSSVPYFSFNFLTEMTHDHLAIPSNLDKQLRNFLNRINSNGYLDNTMLLLFSDHGNRLNYYSYATEGGKLEKNLPFLSIKIPRKLKGTVFSSNLKDNTNKLISFFDIFQTIRQFYHINKYGLNSTIVFEELKTCNKKVEKNVLNERSRRGISLFENVPQNRSCSDALIPLEFCSCFQKINITEQEFERETGVTMNATCQVALDHINNLIDQSKCTKMKFSKVVTVKKLKLNTNLMYSIIFVTNPGEAWFESHFIKHAKNQDIRLKDTPTRLSPYGNQSQCIRDDFLANFCYCSSSNI